MVKLPVRFNPHKLLADDSVFFAEIPVAHFKRLCGALMADKGTVNVKMTFIAGIRKRVSVKGRFDSVCTMQCQRCLTGFEQALSGEFELTFATDKAMADDLPDELDPVILDERGHIHTVDMLEDELILRLPVAPRHAELKLCCEQGFDSCSLESLDGLAVPDGSLENDKGANPFDVLKNFTKQD
jgi:uncharacterized protein